ncbi:Arm DNA-binding domain-containing protein [Nitrobacter sp. TKz-YC01]|uniref:Arm DNA-binding domain-containing protein n=1 Tax=Nitrobacter sp. TKz-YC01 TaxID=3398703 RepID=UPI003A102F06
MVDPTGTKRWVLRTIVHGRRRDIGLGGLRLVSLAAAREKAAEYRRIAREGGKACRVRVVGRPWRRGIRCWRSWIGIKREISWGTPCTWKATEPRW